VSRWANENPEEAARIARLPMSEQNAALREAMAPAVAEARRELAGRALCDREGHLASPPVRDALNQDCIVEWTCPRCRRIVTALGVKDNNRKEQ
jgi:hypothetical protein